MIETDFIAWMEEKKSQAEQEEKQARTSNTLFFQQGVKEAMQRTIIEFEYHFQERLRDGK